MMRFAGPEEAVMSTLGIVDEMVTRNKGKKLRIAKDDAENEMIWKARKVSFALVLAVCARKLTLLFSAGSILESTTFDW